MDGTGGGGSHAPARFRILPKTPTVTDNVQADGSQRKVMENGVLYIIKNGVRYNALGQVIK